MSTSRPADRSLRSLVEAPHYTTRVLEVVQRIDDATDVAALVVLLHQASLAIGADAAMFTSFIRDDATLASYRSLLAGDAAWGTLYAEQGWCAHDPWLAHAARHTEPLRGSHVRLDTPEQRMVIEAADGSLSYWALRHPVGQADFHHGDGFAYELPAMEAS